MCKNKVYQTLVKFFFLGFVCFLVSFNSTCKDPEEFEPVDSLLPPPSPPGLIHPFPDTVFPCGVSYDVFFYWKPIESAGVYQIQIDTASTFSTELFLQVSSPPTTIKLNRYGNRTDYFARIRAGSSLWIWYTDWSEIRLFHLIRDI